MIAKALPLVLVTFAVYPAFGGAAWAQGSPSYTIEDVTACSADAMRLCRSKMPDIDAIEDCMKANYQSLRPKCKARFDKDH